MNIQELETIKFNNLNIKIIIIENNGYLSIKQTEKVFNKMIAAGPESGLGIPDFVKICNAYGLKTSHTKNIEDTRNKFNEHFNKTEPHVFIVSVIKIRNLNLNLLQKDSGWYTVSLPLII